MEWQCLYQWVSEERLEENLDEVVISRLEAAWSVFEERYIEKGHHSCRPSEGLGPEPEHKLASARPLPVHSGTVVR